MSAKEFWEDDPQLFVSYRTSFINKKKREVEEIDYKCWLQGVYNFKGNNNLVSGLIQVLLCLLGGKGGKREKIEEYPKKPFNELEKEKLNEKEKEKERYKKQNELLICQASIKQIYLDKIKQKEKE